MSYTKTVWENKPSTKTPLSAENLNHMDNGIKEAHEAITLLERYKAAAIITSHEGETIATTDSANVPPVGITLFGKSEQKQYEGNQLFKPTATGSSWTGVICTIDENDKCIFNGTYKDSTVITDIGQTFTIPSDGDYTFHVEVENLSSSGWMFQHRGSDNGEKEVLIYHESKTHTINAVQGDVFHFYMSIAAGATLTNASMQIDINHGTEFLGHEPYVGNEPSPNMNYPQEVESLGESGSIGGKIGGENLIDVNGIHGREWSLKLEDSVKVTIDGDNLIIEILKRGNNIILPFFVKCRGYWTRYIEFTFSDGITENRRWFTRMGDKSYGEQYNPGEGGGTFYIGGNIDYVDRIQIGCGDVWFEAGTIITLTRSYVNKTGNGFTPYIATQPFTALTPNGLRGIPLGTTIPDVIANSPIHMSGVYQDENGQYRIADTRDYESGESTQRIARHYITVDDVIGKSGLSTNEASDFYVDMDDVLPSEANKLSFIMSNIASQGFYQKFNVINTVYTGGNTGGRPYFCVSADVTSTAEEFKALCIEKGAYFDYVLLEPITTDLTEEEMAQFNALVMNKGYNNIINDAGAYMRAELAADTQMHIEQNYTPNSKYNALEERVAALEQNAVNS